MLEDPWSPLKPIGPVILVETNQLPFALLGLVLRCSNPTLGPRATRSSPVEALFGSLFGCQLFGAFFAGSPRCNIKRILFLVHEHFEIGCTLKTLACCRCFSLLWSHRANLSGQPNIAGCDLSRSPTKSRLYMYICIALHSYKVRYAYAS